MSARSPTMSPRRVPRRRLSDAAPRGPAQLRLGAARRRRRDRPHLPARSAAVLQSREVVERRPSARDPAGAGRLKLRLRLTLIARRPHEGRPRARAVRALCQARRRPRAAPWGSPRSSWREIDESRARRAEDRRAEEARAILAAVPKGAWLTLLDERGAALTSAPMGGRDRQGPRRRGRRAYAVVIGGPDGLDPALRAGSAHARQLSAR